MKAIAMLILSAITITPFLTGILELTTLIPIK
jgi:hypothetical protein